MLVHVPIPIDALEQTAGVWAPFLESIAQRTRQSIEQILVQIQDGSVHLHVAWEPDEQKAYALAGTRILLEGDDKVGQIIWLTGMERGKWLALFPEFEKYHREHLGCVGMSAIARRGWVKELKAGGYRVSHVLAEKRF